MIEQITSQVTEELSEDTLSFLKQNEKSFIALSEKYRMEVTLTDDTLTINFFSEKGIVISSYGIFHATAVNKGTGKK